MIKVDYNFTGQTEIQHPTSVHYITYFAYVSQIPWTLNELLHSQDFFRGQMTVIYNDSFGCIILYPSGH